MTVDSQIRHASIWLSPGDVRLTDLQEVLDTDTRLEDYPHAACVEQQVLIYEAAQVCPCLDSPADGRALLGELVRAWSEGPGIVVFTGAFEEPVIDAATAAFNDLIARQRAEGVEMGDHFAQPGANDRVWNALEKLALNHPDVFVSYYANEVIAAASRAWLGPGYQVTSQVNVVNPGGAGQSVHRDYHLGFLQDDVAYSYPAHVHRLSPALTLQGAIAHVDMPVESGPTLYLPYSQKYLQGYIAWRRPEFIEYFRDHRVQLPLSKGDAVFFNPALLHAAGANTSRGIHRMANLLQVSSPFGRAMESVDRSRVISAIYPSLQAARDSGVPEAALARVIAASAEGYPFPRNLDRDRPSDDMTPQTQATAVARALAGNLAPAKLAADLERLAAVKSSH